ncbi:hypothetical protein [Nocardioides sp. URHA0020]|uniref:hypothetical protein n=1 Tax=Nocardioides sp. URHA0020 TaxID=1380392 RepID=UPI0018CC0305|nr:hypothetical protein [Nocardioides sp. URHA0020]
MPEEPDEPLALDDRERRFLRAAMLEWGGPAKPTDALAVALGFTKAATMSGETWALWERIESGEVLSSQDWRRVLAAAEAVFASDVFGSGLDWPTTSGMPDAESIAVLRGLQRKLPRCRGSTQFTVNDSGSVTLSDPERPQP